MSIEDYLSLNQIRGIIEVIKHRCLMFKQYNELLYKPYAANRAKHCLTGVVISGFSPKFINIPGLKSEDVYYGLMNRLCQPEIRCDKAVFHIYSNGSKLNNKVIIDRCRKINATDIPPVFFIIQFYASEDGTLQSIKAKYFDSKARVIHTESIYQAAKVIKLTA